MKLLTDKKQYKDPSVFTPENLLREARRQMGIKNGKVPDVCVLDPDGDLVDYLIRTNQAKINECWACYHTKLYNVKQNDFEFTDDFFMEKLSVFCTFLASDLFTCFSKSSLSMLEIDYGFEQILFAKIRP